MLPQWSVWPRFTVPTLFHLRAYHKACNIHRFERFYQFFFTRRTPVTWSNIILHTESSKFSVNHSSALHLIIYFPKSTKTKTSCPRLTKWMQQVPSFGKPNLLNQIFVSKRFSVAFIKFYSYVARPRVIKQWKCEVYSQNPLSLVYWITAWQNITTRHALNWIKTMLERLTAVDVNISFKGFPSQVWVAGAATGIP